MSQEIKIDLTSYRIEKTIYENPKLFEKLKELIESFPEEKSEEWKTAIFYYLGKKWDYRVLLMEK